MKGGSRIIKAFRFQRYTLLLFYDFFLSYFFFSYNFCGRDFSVMCRPKLPGQIDIHLYSIGIFPIFISCLLGKMMALFLLFVLLNDQFVLEYSRKQSRYQLGIFSDCRVEGEGGSKKRHNFYCIFCTHSVICDDTLNNIYK